MRKNGKLAWWNDQKGYGFISPEDGGKRVFVHMKAFGNRGQRPGVEQQLTYAMSVDRQGRPCAVRVDYVDALSPSKHRLGRGGLSIVVALVSLCVVGMCVLVGLVPAQIFALYVLASLITFIVYAVDKSHARKGKWRTRESTLHLLSLVGGWPGAMVAQQVLGHKSSKQSFRSGFWFTVMMNCGAFICLLTPNGSAMSHSFINRVLY